MIDETGKEKSISFISSGLRLLVDARFPSIPSKEEFVEKWALVSTKQFRKDGSNYDSWGITKRKNAAIDKENILSILDSQLLAFIIEEFIDELDEDEFEFFFEKTLFNIQSLNVKDEAFKNSRHMISQLSKEEINQLIT